MIQAVFQNNFFFICEKSSGVLSVPAREKTDSRVCLGTQLQQQLQRQIFPVHRLDFEVSGLIMFALDSQSHRVAQGWFEKKQIQKKYLARTSLQDFSHWPQQISTDRTALTLVPEQEFLWRTQILRGKRRSFESEHGEWAETKAIVKSFNRNGVEWVLYPVTGKSHQLRLELSRRGFPIAGDKLYGSVEELKKNEIALKAVEINLEKVSERLGLPEKISL